MQLENIVDNREKSNLNLDTTTHGKSRTRLYKIYHSIKSRCYNKNHKHYKLYGGAGVTISKEWLDDFMKFYDWAMANGYEENLEIDKDRLCIEQNIEPKIYGADTCEWVTHIGNTQGDSTSYKIGETGIKNVTKDKRRGTYFGQKAIHGTKYRTTAFKTPQEAKTALNILLAKASNEK